MTVPSRVMTRWSFSDRRGSTNQWLPLRPGAQLIFEGESVEDGEQIRHRVSM